MKKVSMYSAVASVFLLAAAPAAVVLLAMGFGIALPALAPLGVLVGALAVSVRRAINGGHATHAEHRVEPPLAADGRPHPRRSGVLLFGACRNRLGHDLKPATQLPSQAERAAQTAKHTRHTSG